MPQSPRFMPKSTSEHLLKTTNLFLVGFPSFTFSILLFFSAANSALLSHGHEEKSHNTVKQNFRFLT